MAQSGVTSSFILNTHSPMIAQLIPVDGSSPIQITRDVTLVGRKRGICDVILQSTSVSKLHCAIAKTDGLLFFRDLGSTNGTKVNGQRVTRGALLPGDELCFANLKFRVHLGPSMAPAVTPERTEQMSTFPRVAGDGNAEFEFAEHGNAMRNPRPRSN